MINALTRPLNSGYAVALSVLLALGFLAAPARAQAPNIATSVAEASAYIPGTFGTEITTGSGYDIATGAVTRRIADFSVPGSVGAYPLNVTRTYTSPTGWHMSYLWYARESFLGGGGYDYTKLDEFDDPMSKHYIWIVSPDGKAVACDANPDPAPDRLPGDTYDVTRTPDTRITAIVIHFPDGGKVRLEMFGSSTASTRFFRPVWLDDPYGLRYTYTYTDANDSLPDQITDASGRWIKFYGSIVSGNGVDFSGITRAESSAGQWASYTATTSGSTKTTAVSYWDGTSASYVEGAVFGSTWGLTSANDVKALSAMRAVEYTYAGANLPAPNSNQVAWVEVATEKHAGGPVVSTRTVLQRNNNKWVNGRPYLAWQVQETRGDGPSRTFTMDRGWGHLNSFTDFRGNTSSYEHTYALLSTYPTKVTDALGHATTLTLSDTVDCRPITITFPDATTKQYTWYNKSFLASVTDERGKVTTYTRDTNNRITRIDYPDGGYETFAYGSYNKLTQRRNRNGSSNYYDYDASGNLYRYWPETFAAKSTSIPYFEYAYYPSGNAWVDRVQTERDPRGNVTTFEYNARGQVTKVTHADTTYLAFGYDDYGNKVWEENELRQRTAYTYDDYNRLLNTTNPASQTTQIQYADTTAGAQSHTSKSPRRVISPVGRIAAWLYDGDWRPTLKANGDWSGDTQYILSEYDAAGNQTRQRVQVGGTAGSGSEVYRDTTYAYDTRDRKRYEYAPLGRTTEWRYDNAGNILTTVFPDATTRTKTYDPLNRPLTETDERGYTTTYAYYPSGKINTITDARSSTYTHTYDAANRLASRTYPGGSVERWTYDEFGSMATYTNRSGQILRYAYDNRNRETARAWDGGAAPSVATGYDAASRVTSRGNVNSTLGYSFDAAGRLVTASEASAGGPSVTLTYGYDNDGLRTSFSSSFNTWIGYAYNNRGEVTRLQDWAGSGPETWSSYTRDVAGEITSQGFFNGVRDDRTYDGAGRLNYDNTIRNSDSASFLLRRFGYDLRDRRTWSLRNDAYGDTYEYLADGELSRFRSQVSRPDQNFSNPAAATNTYAYDAVGNRSTVNTNGAVVNYTADALNQYTAVTGATTGYDARGNLTTWNEWTYTYDADNRLTSASKTGYAVQFYYDPEGRLSKVNRNGTWEHRYYDGVQCFFRSQPDGTWIDFMFWGATPDELNARWDAAHGGWSYFHRDPLNSPDVATDIGGNVVERYLYDPYGQPDIRDASWGTRTSSAIANPWLFTGQEWMPDLGLSNYKNRFYSPKLGRFLQNDPVRFDAGDANLYRYAGNDPVDRIDPSGLADVNLTDPSDNSFKAGESVPKGGEEFTVAFHGAKDGGFYADAGRAKPISTGEVIKTINSDSNHGEGQPVRLFTCFAGNENNLPAVKEIASATKSPIIVADDVVTVAHTAKSNEFKGATVGEKNPGNWIKVNPNGTTEKATPPAVNPKGTTPAPAGAPTTAPGTNNPAPDKEKH